MSPLFDEANARTFGKAFQFIADNPGFLLTKAVEQLELAGAALGIGFVNNMVALAVLATGPILTNSYGGVEGVDRDVVEAARGMGMSGAQILGRVELPLAIPLIFTGIRVSAVTVVATAPIAAIAGGGGLGDVIVNQAAYRLEGVIGASLCVMALSAGVWVALVALQKALTPRGLRGARVAETGGP